MPLRARHLVLAAFVFAPTAALADIAPPQGYVETCTVERQQQQGEACRLCTGAYHGDRDFCVREFGSQGFEQRCRTRGASVWSEVWCASPEVAAAFASGAGTPTIEVVIATPGSGEGAVVDGSVPTEPPAVARGEGSVPAEVPVEPSPAPEAATTADEEASAEAEPAPPEAAPAETPGRRGCGAGGTAASALVWLPVLALRRRRRQNPSC